MSTCAVHHEIPAAAYCRTCGRALCASCKREVRGVVYCEDCIAARVQDTMPAAAPAGVAPAGRRAPSPALAAVLGFIPGVGAMYNGQFMKAFVHVVIFASLIWAAERVEFFGVFIAFWVFYMVFDAYKTARAMELGQPLPDPLGLNRMLGISEVPPANIGGGGGAVAGSEVANPGAAPVTGQAQASSGPPLGAILLIGVGVLFLLDNMGLFRFRWVGRLWPLVLIAIGVWMFVRRVSPPPGEQP